MLSRNNLTSSHAYRRRVSERLLQEDRFSLVENGGKTGWQDNARLSQTRPGMPARPSNSTGRSNVFGNAWPENNVEIVQREGDGAGTFIVTEKSAICTEDDPPSGRSKGFGATWPENNVEIVQRECGGTESLILTEKSATCADDGPPRFSDRTLKLLHRTYAGIGSEDGDSEGIRMRRTPKSPSKAWRERVRKVLYGSAAAENKQLQLVQDAQVTEKVLDRKNMIWLAPQIEDGKQLIDTDASGGRNRVESRDLFRSKFDSTPYIEGKKARKETPETNSAKPNTNKGNNGDTPITLRDLESNTGEETLLSDDNDLESSFFEKLQLEEDRVQQKEAEFLSLLENTALKPENDKNKENEFLELLGVSQDNLIPPERICESEKQDHWQDIFVAFENGQELPKEKIDLELSEVRTPKEEDEQQHLIQGKDQTLTMQELDRLEQIVFEQHEVLARAWAETGPKSNRKCKGQVKHCT